MTFALAAGWPAGAQDTKAVPEPGSPPPAPVTFSTERPKLHLLAPKGTVRGKPVPKPIEGMDPRPWSNVVGWRPGESQFPSAENSQGVPLFWVAVGPSGTTP